MPTYYDENLKIWYGKKKPFKFSKEDSLGSVALKSLKDEPELIAQICYPNDRSMTNKEMAKLSVQAGCFIEKLQMPQGAIIGMCVSNSDYVTPVVLGCLMAGKSISTLDPSFDVGGIKHIYSQTRPQLMICDGDAYEKVRKAFDECELFSTVVYTMKNHIAGVPSILEFFESQADVTNYRVPALKNGYNDTAFIVCSSGTTGLPKAVTLSIAFLLSIGVFPTPHLRHLCFSSLHWLTGVFCMLRCLLTHGIRVISEQPFSPDQFFDIVKRYRINVVTGPPSHIAMALASSQIDHSDLSSIQMYVTGGSTVRYALIEKFQKFTPNAKFRVIYGMTECGGRISVGNCEPGDSVGFLIQNIEVKIIDENGIKLGPNETGEICVRSALPWAGYYGNREATQAAYDTERWYHSGDVGFFNGQQKLFIVDRKKDILKYNNFHFSLSAIEKVVSEMPDVLEACVVGLPDETYGFLPAAAVIRKQGSLIEAYDICQHVKEKMQHFEQLRGGVFFVDNLPRTFTGKTLRREVTAYCEKIQNQKAGGKLEEIQDTNYLSKQSMKIIN